MKFESTKFNKIESLKYMVANSTYCDEWSGAGMYGAVETIIQSEDESFEKEYLDELLEEASNF